MRKRKKQQQLTNQPFPPLSGVGFATSAVVGITIPVGASIGQVPNPSVQYNIPREQTTDIRMGRDEDGKWILGRHKFDTQIEMLEAVQNALDELYGTDEDMLGTGIFGPRSFP